MEAAGRAAIVCAFACIVAVFVPAGRLDVGGRFASGATSRSLYQLGRTTGAVRDFVARYHRSTAAKLGSRALDKLKPHLRGDARSNAGDVQDAMSTLDELRDEDVKTAGIVVTVVMWSLLALNLVLMALVYGTNAATSRRRVAAALVVALITAGLAVAIHLVLRTVVAEANAELGRHVLSLRGGAYAVPLAGLAALVATLAWMILYVRTRGALVRRAAAPA